MRFVALQNRNLFFNSFFPPNYESFVKKCLLNSLLHTAETYKNRIEKHKILKCVCLSSFWIGCAKKDRKIYPLNLSILQQITVNGVNFCTAYVFGKGQLISKQFLGVIDFLQKSNETSRNELS